MRELSTLGLRVIGIQYLDDGAILTAQVLFSRRFTLAWRVSTGNRESDVGLQGENEMFAAASCAKCFIIGDGHQLRLWTLGVNEPKLLRSAGGLLNAVAISSDGHTIAYSSRTTPDGCEITVQQGESPICFKSALPPNWLEFDSSARFLLASSSSSFTFWDCERRESVGTGTSSLRWAAVRLSPRSNLVALCHKSGILLRHPTFARSSALLDIGGAWLSAIAFSPDQRFLLTGDAAGLVRQWDLSSNQVARSFNWNIGEVSALAVAPDGLTAAVGGSDGRVVIWDLDL